MTPTSHNKTEDRVADARTLARRTAPAALAIAAIIAAGLAGPAQAGADPVTRFQIPPQRVDNALLDLALQSRRSLGGDIGACHGMSPAITGALSVETALGRILAGSGCTYAMRPDGAIFIRRAPRPSPAPSPVARAAAPSTPLAEPATTLTDIVVTSPRRSDLTQRVPSAVAAVPGSQLDLARANDLGAVASLTAGMTVTNLGSGRNKILLRGMSDGAFTGLTQSTVALYLDQTPITYSAPDPDLKLIDVDRIEILRGPQGTLYGTGPIGGVVHILTRRPDFEDRELRGSVTRSWTRGGGPNSDYSVIGNLPLFDGAVALRGNLYREKFGGYINDVNLNLHRVNEGERRGGRVAGAVNLAPGWVATAGYNRQVIESEDTHYVYRILGGLTRANLVREPHRNHFSELYLSLAGEGEWGRLSASVAQVRHRFNSRYDASSALPAFGSINRIGALDEAKDIDLTVGELTLASPDANRLRWLAGAYLSTSQTAANTAISVVRAIPLTVYSERRADDLDEFALFGEVSYDLVPGVTLTAGARGYGFDYGTVSDVSQRAAHRLFDDTGNTAGVSPKLALAYEVSDTLRVYGQISQGHRTGGFNTAGPIGQMFTGAVGSPTPHYRADTLWNYEAGAKATLWDGRVQARSAVFLARWSDIQSDQFLPSGLAYAVNVGDASNLGIELETTWRPTSHLEIRANGLLADPEITRPSASFNTKGDAGLPGVPAVSANLNASYLRAIWRDISVSAEGGVAYVGASRLTFDAERRSRMGDYVTGRFSIGLEASRWSLRAFVENPLDTQANTFSFGDPFRLPEALATTPLRPRTIGLTLQVFAL